MNLTGISTVELEREIRERKSHDQRQRDIYLGERNPDTEDHLDESHSDHGNRPIGFWRCF